ncbi:MAG: DUF4276 family protein [Chloroflexi bacterium]|nr:DUF4276 family protein [Chloroflexota bacterium]
MLDSDEDCPAQLGPALLQRAVQTRGDLDVAVVLAKCEFESWFLAAAESLGGQRGLSRPLESPSNPESIRGAEEWLSHRMDHGRPYVEFIERRRQLQGIASGSRSQSG